MVNEERDGGEDAAADHERQHVGNAIHKVLVDLVPGRFSVRGRGGSGSATDVVVDGRVTLHDLVDERLGLVDATGDRAAEELLAVEAGELDVLVGGDDDALGTGDILGREDVLGARGALGLDLDAQAHLLGLVLESLGGHVGVGDAGRSGGDGDEVIACGVSGSGSGGLRILDGKLGVLGSVDDGEELLRRLSGAEAVTELRVH